MDALSLLGPPTSKQLTQDEFDLRYSFVSSESQPREETKSTIQWIGDSLREQAYCSRNRLFDVFPSLRWLTRYGLKSDFPRDMLGSLLIASLLLPHGLVSGHLAIDDPVKGLYAIFFPQLLYILLGSSRHSSIGGISFVSLLVASSLSNSNSDVATITLLSSFFHIILWAMPPNWVLPLIPDFLLNGAYLGLLIRLVFTQIPHFIVFKDPHCQQQLSEWCLRWVWRCFGSVDPWTGLLSLCTLLLSALIHHVINPAALDRLQFTLPHELFLILISILLSYVFDFEIQGIAVLSKEKIAKTPSVEVPHLFTNLGNSLLDSISISLFLLASHLKTTRAVAMEKMHKVDRKQEAAAFALIEFPLSFLGFPPVATSIGHSQINVETARFSLVANTLACGWLMVFIVFCLPILEYLPKAVLGGILVLSFPAIPCEILHLRRVYKISKQDCICYILTALSLLLTPNLCRGFLFAIGLNIFLAAHRIFWPERWALARLDGDGRFAEESRYEGEPCDAPARILRFNAPLIFGNTDLFHDAVHEQVKLIKGQVPLGIGTRTGSLRSQVEVRLSAPLEARLSLAQSKTNLTNFVINDPSMIIQGDQPLIRCLIVDFSAISAVDTTGMYILNQVYFELHEDNVKFLFAAVNANVRDSMQAAGLFSLLPRNCFYPTLNDAVLATRAMVMPIHTSVSLNGCRDVIAVSACGSHFDVATIGTNRDNDSKGEPAQV
ncbi:unnamed protein product, partial [Mesorhabditis belari]|uniref:STAS domain-containing protein n=1 Tax=Mesorhabditis belari TaxID=2138241 RepID=A0AAF3J1F2_9BILA